MTRDDIITGFTAKAQSDSRVAALFLGGSLGAGRGDIYSDVDLILVAFPEHHAALTAEVRSWADDIAEIIIWRPPYPGLPLFMAVTTEWHRFDITVTVPGRVTGSKAGLKPLVDHADVWATLPDQLPPQPMPAAQLEALIEETMRILGLLPLAIGREEYAVSVTGIGLLRANLITLMIAEGEPPLPPGAMGLRNVISPEDLAYLTAQPGVAATREAVIAASLDYAGLFLARARALAAKVGAMWPDRLETALRERLGRELQIELP